MWLCNSSIGRKVVMSVTGIALILFLTFHGCMNVVALFSAKGYNMICEFLGANWYAVVATIGLAALALIHIVYAFWLTIQNRKARGSNRYDVTEKPGKVEWASQNMLVLGIIILLGLLLHLFNFWYNMMFAELFPSIHFDPACQHIHQSYLCGALHHLDYCTLVPPRSWFLVSYSDHRLERTHLVQSLARYRHHLCDSAGAHVPCSNYRFCNRPRSIAHLPLR